MSNVQVQIPFTALALVHGLLWAPGEGHTIDDLKEEVAFELDLGK